MGDFTQLKVETTLNQPPELEALRLAPSPAYTVTLVVNDDRALTLKVGKETPTKNGYYVLTEGGKVQVVEKYALEGALDVLKNPPIAATPTAAVTPTVEQEAGTSTPLP